MEGGVVLELEAEEESSERFREGGDIGFFIICVDSTWLIGQERSEMKTMSTMR